MKKVLWQRVILCSLAVLLILGLGAGVIGLSYAGVSIMPKAGFSLREQPTLMLDADISGYDTGKELDPTKLYDRACRQTVYLYLNYKDLDDKDHSVSGTGIIVSNDGYILTNAHVVNDAKAYNMPMQVELYDGRTFEGAIVGADSETDVALIKIEALGFQAATLSRSKLKNAQTVYVMGHPDSNLKYTMTSGIVSGQGREVDFSDGIQLNMFQIDAAINPGNSGGPVYDAYGAVVGMVTAKYMSLTAEGIGFAIPIQDAVTIAGDLKEEGLPGAHAGFIKGDIIVSMGGKTVSSMEDLTRIKKEYKAGDTVKIRFWRDGEYLETYLTFDEVTPEHPTGPVEIEDENTDPSEDEWVEPAPDGEDGETETGENSEEAVEEETP